MYNKKILYFKDGGVQHTISTLEAVKKWLPIIKPEAVIVSSTTGESALKAGQILGKEDVRIIAVSFQENLWSKWGAPNNNFVQESKKLGVEFIPAKPVVSLLDAEHPDIVNAWRTISSGFKVALQVASMCVDTNLIESGARIIALGGTVHGSDTAVAAEIYGYKDILKTNVNCILAMPSAKRS
ncbi:MAG TPA: hypothetical protein QF753_05375 [Victivallales bacterium]|nr:hypothetical protein [Victivallales bacterium]